jgi:uracil phosphoribosyltransferase
MKDSYLSILRNKQCDRPSFRIAANRLSHLIAAESVSIVKEKDQPLRTPISACKGRCIDESVVLVPILRSGIALLSSFLYFLPDAKVGFLGLKRDEKSAKPMLYYEKLPPLSSQDLIFLLDPMVATGGSALLAIEKILKKGGCEKKIHLIGIIGATLGVRAIKTRYPRVHIHLAAIDKKLNAKKFITPGLGDFGDRYFGTL